jgi:putative OPT family oligopeptide transporter
MQIVGVVAAAIVIAPILSLLFNAYGLGGVFPREGMNPQEMLTALQATLMQAVAEGVFARNLEWPMIIIGGLIAVAIIILDQILKSKGSEFRTPVLAVAVGIYLPVELSVPIFIGGMIAWSTTKLVRDRARKANEDIQEAEGNAERKGLLFSSGLITGEALIGIILAIPFALFESTDALRLMPEGMEWLTSLLGVGAIIFFMMWLYKVAIKKGD